MRQKRTALLAAFATLTTLASLASAHAREAAIHTLEIQKMPRALVILDHVEIFTPLQKLETVTVGIATITRTTGSDWDILVGGRGLQVEVTRTLRDDALVSALKKWKRLLPGKQLQPFQHLDDAGRPGTAVSVHTSRRMVVSALFPFLLRQGDGNAFAVPTQLTTQELEAFLSVNPELQQKLSGLGADQIRFAPRTLAPAELEIIPDPQDLVDYRPSAVMGVVKTEKEKQELASCRQAARDLLQNAANPIPAGVPLNIVLAPVNLNCAVLILQQELGTSLSGYQLRLSAEGSTPYRRTVPVELMATGVGSLFDAGSVGLDSAELSGVTVSLDAVIHQDQCFIPEASLVEPVLKQAEQLVLRKLHQK